MTIAEAIEVPSPDPSSDNDVRVFIDSGAFSAWRLGRPVDLNAYCAFLEEHRSWVDVAAALDVIIPDDPEEAARQSFANLLYMRKRGLDPVPVWHVRESTDWIKRILDLGCTYIGLSATSIVSRTATDDWYEMAWSYLVDSTGAPLVRVHSFGEARLEILERYPWASADSSTWLEGEKRGTMILPDGAWMAHTKAKSSSASRQDVDLLEGLDKEAFEAILDLVGVRRSAFSDRDSHEARSARLLVTLYRFREIQRLVRAQMPIRFRPPRLGLISRPQIPAKRPADFPDEFRVFLAAGTNNMAMPCAHVMGMRNILASYFFLDARKTGRLRDFRADPSAAMQSPPYDKYLALARSVLTQEI